ncbi:hypothetical protein, partial [Flavobacterium sp.]|uniref:hypothetical protein n=1 Tax=Flavobacterium sp. TaxID=239 RepID=UPI0025B89DDA
IILVGNFNSTAKSCHFLVRLEISSIILVGFLMACSSAMVNKSSSFISCRFPLIDNALDVLMQLMF